MKKKYISPTTNVIRVSTQCLLANSILDATTETINVTFTEDEFNGEAAAPWLETFDWDH